MQKRPRHASKCMKPSLTLGVPGILWVFQAQRLFHCTLNLSIRGVASPRATQQSTPFARQKRLKDSKKNGVDCFTKTTVFVAPGAGTRRLKGPCAWQLLVLLLATPIAEGFSLRLNRTRHMLQPVLFCCMFRTQNRATVGFGCLLEKSSDGPCTYEILRTRLVARCARPITTYRWPGRSLTPKAVSIPPISNYLAVG